MAAGARIVLHTPRLRLQELDDGDEAFVVELLNDPDFLRQIGDRGVRDVDGARRYLADGPRASYAAHGFGLWKAVLADSGEAAGMCGLLRRPTLPDADLGYAWLPRFRGQGLAREAAAAALRHAFDVFALPRVLAIVSPGNTASETLLAKIGFRLRGLEPVGDNTLNVYVAEAPVAR